MPYNLPDAAPPQFGHQGTLSTHSVIPASFAVANQSLYRLQSPE